MHARLSLYTLLSLYLLMFTMFLHISLATSSSYAPLVQEEQARSEEARESITWYISLQLPAFTNSKVCVKSLAALGHLRDGRRLRQNSSPERAQDQCRSRIPLSSAHFFVSLSRSFPSAIKGVRMYLPLLWSGLRVVPKKWYRLECELFALPGAPPNN